jgi:hypothetical protein
VLENLPSDTLPRLLRRTTLSTIIAGTIGFIVAMFIAPLAALGVIIGVTMAVVNLRFLDGQAAKVELRGEQSTKAIRRQLGGKTASRLAIMTAIALAAVFLNAALGIGIVSGLVIYQLVFVVNVIRVVSSQGGVE